MNPMKFSLSKHAKNELVNRQIPFAILESVIENPQQILNIQNGKKVFQSQVVFEKGRIYLVRVIVNDRVEPFRIITVYKTSKIEKYWRET